METVSPARRLHSPGGERGSHESGARLRPVRGKRWLVVALVAALAVALPEPVLAEPSEQEVKAALIFNITRFVEWPTAAFSSPNAPMVVAIMGKDEVSAVLGTMLVGRSVDGHPLEVRYLKTGDEVRKCHVLYIASSEKRKTDEILKDVRGASTLTVADIDRFAERGGHVNLVLEDRRVQLFVNPTSARDCGLTISARMLSLVQIVGATR